MKEDYLAHSSGGSRAWCWHGLGSSKNLMVNASQCWEHARKEKKEVSEIGSKRDSGQVPGSLITILSHRTSHE
jgi:hypothetical protein